MSFRRKIFLGILFINFILLTGCGTLIVQVENPQHTPSPEQSTITPTKRATSIVVSATDSGITPTSTTAPVTGGGAGQPTASAQPGPSLTPGTSIKISFLKMLDPQNGWSIAQVDTDLFAHILLTSDGGKSWKDRTPAAPLLEAPADGLDAVAFFNSTQQAWVIFYSRMPQVGEPSPVIWRTADGGATWSKSSSLELSGVEVEFQVPSDLGFLDALHGWVMLHIGAGMMHDYIAVFTTSDGGSTWQKVLDPTTGQSIMSCQKSGLAFTTAMNAWLSGNCPGLMPSLFLYRSTDGGLNWEEINLPVPEGKPAEYYSQNNVACGIDRINFATARSLDLTLTCSDLSNRTALSWLYSSADGGLTWNDHLLPLPHNDRISLLRTDEGFLVGSAQQDSNQGGAVYHMTNNGSGWSLVTLTQWTGQPDFVDNLNGWVIAAHNGESALVRTTDGGKSWVVLKPVVE